MTPNLSTAPNGLTLTQAGSHVEELTRMLLTEIDSLKGLVGNRSSVPKEQVYPRFDSLASMAFVVFESAKHSLEVAQHPRLGPHQWHPSSKERGMPMSLLVSKG